LTNELLVNLGIELVNAFISNTENSSNLFDSKSATPKLEENFSALDNDGNGKDETIIETRADGTQVMYIDTDDNGFADTKVIIGKDGIPVYEPEEISLYEQPMLITAKANKITLDAKHSTWEEWHKNQTVKPGEDGFITKVVSASSDGEYVGRKTYFVNGMLNEYDGAINSAMRISSELGEPVFQVYSKSELQNDNGKIKSGMYDATTAGFNLALNNELTESGVSLATSMAIDLVAGKPVLVFAHSRGAAVTYNAVNSVADYLKSTGNSGYLKNLTVVTLGGYSPPTNQWNPAITIQSHVNPGDPIPLLRNNNQGGVGSLDNHVMESYFKFIKQYKK
jgi:hypothetical protein